MVRKRHWSLPEVRNYSTDRIFAKLHEFGVEITPDEFRQSVPAYYSHDDLVDDWEKHYDLTAEGYDKDFILMAAIVLWQRLTPEVFSGDLMHDAIEQGYDYLKIHRDEKTCDIWLDCWDKFKAQFVPRLNAFSEIDEKLTGGLYLTSAWLLDIETELANAGLTNPEYQRKHLQYCEEFLQLFPDADEESLGYIKSGRAQAHLERGNTARGEELFRQLVEEHPGFTWGYIHWGDIYWLKNYPHLEVDYQKAEDIYRMGLKYGEGDRQDVLERLKELEQARPQGKGFGTTVQKKKGEKSQKKK
ncbi:tetratricopeptide repeat protein [Phormidium sp. CCY1219]|uniref:tetratricopeptide repeat protein n=1 Tax=Phormidium sp. CCY1219 TaxID=2886104 RepID=UPI002D1F9933|nr:hypothetical protein [Phormidium sp. CCY1219]MEB3827404.1 hypothetical protein [Phormidium sp. CCY1219]